MATVAQQQGGYESKEQTAVFDIYNGDHANQSRKNCLFYIISIIRDSCDHADAEKGKKEINLQIDHVAEEREQQQIKSNCYRVIGFSVVANVCKNRQEQQALQKVLCNQIDPFGISKRFSDVVNKRCGSERVRLEKYVLSVRIRESIMSKKMARDKSPMRNIIVSVQRTEIEPPYQKDKENTKCRDHAKFRSLAFNQIGVNAANKPEDIKSPEGKLQYARHACQHQNGNNSTCRYIRGNKAMNFQDCADTCAKAGEGNQKQQRMPE